MATTPVSDQILRDDILHELKYDPRIVVPEEIAVSVKDGVVMLNGFVSNYWEKTKPQRLRSTSTA